MKGESTDEKRMNGINTSEQIVKLYILYDQLTEDDKSSIHRLLNDLQGIAYNPILVPAVLEEAH